ncbi:MAG: Fpg/Nei family DNA glycosylase [Myxococcaceae bacterium]|nr:Fpg/Nei family DNA glycosylase [Myxococcaceae bacterium]
MPEGDTLYRAAKTLQLALGGKRVVELISEYAHVAVAVENHPVAGETVEEVSAVGKHLLMRFSHGYTLRTHMRMNGSWHLYRPGERWKRPKSAMRLVLRTADFEAVAFDVPVAELVDDKQLARGELGRLGPDLLNDDPFDVDEAVARLRAKGPQPIGELLLNQRVAAGMGNVYKSEVLFMCGVRPDRRGPDVSDAELRELWATAQQLMRANVQVGSDEGITTYFGLRRTTRAQDPSQRLWVYGREGEPCRKCGALVKFFKQGLGARSTYFCERCQR